MCGPRRWPGTDCHFHLCGFGGPFTCLFCTSFLEAARGFLLPDIFDDARADPGMRGPLLSTFILPYTLTIRAGAAITIPLVVFLGPGILALV